ncbi:MAG: site-2 protease family protein [Chthonomonas sp.]|nr:site-2 protease family protein [Chthonomonas sp.]
MLDPKEPMGIFLTIVMVLLSIGIHEFAHAKVADSAGDPTPRAHGRVTLNIFNHIDPIGGIMIVLMTMSGYGIGWGRPVPMDPGRMRNPRWDHFAAVAAGPISNLIQAGVYAIIYRSLLIFNINPGPAVLFFILIGVLVNVGLFLFNLIPLGPLDGMWLLSAFLHGPSRISWIRWNLTMGSFALLGIILISQVANVNLLGYILGPVREQLTQLLLG